MLAEIVIFDGVDELDVIGVHEVLSRARRLGADLEPRLVVLPQRSRAVTAAHGVRLWAESSLSQSADLLVIPGGGWSLPAAAGIRREVDSGELPAAVASAHERGAIIASVCTGAMALAAAGLLQGRRATTHRSALAALGAAGAIAVPDRVVDEGSVVTSGGVTSGLDLGLHLV
ncbi:MAG: DJ-1/PfpI family protein, partial [Candidatus Dormibacteria bacterium]